MRKKFIISKKENIRDLLFSFRGKERVPYEEVMTESSLKGGSFSAAVSDAKILKLLRSDISDGTLEITDHGTRLLENPEKNLKELGLGVPLFREMYDRRIDNLRGSEEFLYFILKEKYTGNTLKNYSKAAARRYLEYVYGKEVYRQTSRTQRSANIQTQLSLRQEDSIKTRLKNNVGLNDDEIASALSLMMGQLQLDEKKKSALVKEFIK